LDNLVPIKFCLGSRENNKPFGNQAEGLFLFFYLKKEGFLKILLNYKLYIVFKRKKLTFKF